MTALDPIQSSAPLSQRCLLSKYWARRQGRCVNADFANETIDPHARPSKGASVRASGSSTSSDVVSERIVGLPTGSNLANRNRLGWRKQPRLCASRWRTIGRVLPEKRLRSDAQRIEDESDLYSMRHAEPAAEPWRAPGEFVHVDGSPGACPVRVGMRHTGVSTRRHAERDRRQGRSPPLRPRLQNRRLPSKPRSERLPIAAYATGRLVAELVCLTQGAQRISAVHPQFTLNRK